MLPAVIVRPVRRQIEIWARRRGPTSPPLKLGYRQIYILPTTFGWLLGLLMFAMLVGSLNFNNNLGLLTTFLVAGLALTSMLSAYRNLEGLEIPRIDADPPFAGDDLNLALTLRDADGRERPLLELHHDGRHGRGSLHPYETGPAVLKIPTRARGHFKPGRIRLYTRYPLGLFEAWSWLWPERSFRVWPRPARRAPPLPVGRGEQGQPRPGDEGDEYHGLRPWRESDPLHRIAWKASQRHEQLLAREFRQLRSTELRLSLANAAGANLEERLSVLTAWVLQAERRGLRWTLDLGRLVLGPDEGELHRIRCLNAMADYNP